MTDSNKNSNAMLTVYDYQDHKNAQNYATTIKTGKL